METLIFIIIWIGITVLQIALVVAIFTIKNQSQKQTALMQEQLSLLKDIKNQSYLHLLKDVHSIQVKSKARGVKGNEEEVKVITASQWLMGYGGTDTHSIEKVE